MSDTSGNARKEQGNISKADGAAGNSSLPQAVQVQAAKDWFSKCSVKKEKTLKKLFVLKNGVARRFTSVEYDAWKLSFNSFVNSCGFPGLLMVATQVIKFDEHNRLINLPTDDGGNLEDTPHSVQQKRYILKAIADTAGSYIGMPNSSGIELLQEDEIDFQVRGLVRFLAEVSYNINNACEVPDTDECVYRELQEIPGNITVLKNGMPHPTKALMQLSWIDTQVSVDPCGTGMHQREQLEQELLSLQEDNTLTLHSFKQLLDDLKQKVVSIQNRDPRQSHSTNESAQEKFSDALKVTCRRIERESKDAKQQKAAELIRLGLLRIDELVVKPAIHDFHVQVTHMLNRFVPPKTSSSSETQEPASKRVKTECSGDSLALLVKDLPDNLALQVLKHACKIPGRSSDGQVQRCAQLSEEDKSFKQSSARPAWWMCRNCCELGHDESECRNDPDPERASKFDAHITKNRANHGKRLQRQRAHARNMNNPDAVPVTARQPDSRAQVSNHQVNSATTQQEYVGFPFSRILTDDNADQY